MEQRRRPHGHVGASPPHCASLCPGLQRLIDENGVAVPFFDDFDACCRLLLGHPGIVAPEPAPLLEFFYQGRRAWFFPASKILGTSPSAVRACLSIWRANLGRDACLYAGGLYGSMAEIPVLITGAPGCGKELAAECIAWSRYIPFDAAGRRFLRKPKEDYHPWNACEVPTALVESSLFGHKRGAFTGATEDSPGFFGLSRVHAMLFLDEVGELPLHVQAKLLRPLQNRAYARVGEHELREIRARLAFATRRDLRAMCREGTFREDLFERMNGARVHMPLLQQMLAERPGDLRTYVRAFVGERIKAPKQAETWTDMVVSAIETKRPGYGWPGNLRELQHYSERGLLDDEDGPPSAAPAALVLPSPPARATTPPPESTRPPYSQQILGRRAKAGEVSFDEVRRAFVTRVYFLTGQNACETARRTGLHRKTVMRLVDFKLLRRWQKDET